MDTSILTDPDLKNIYLKMLDYLSQNDMAEKRLVKRIERLRLRYPHTLRYVRYTAENAWKVIPLLREQGYVDDLRYAENIYNVLKDKRDGLRAIQRKMIQRDIHPKVVETVIKQHTAAGERQDLAKITKAAELKFRRLSEKYGNDPIKKHQIRDKLYAWLLQRGYGMDEIGKIWASISR